jgi:hypothetical protein
VEWLERIQDKTMSGQQDCESTVMTMMTMMTVATVNQQSNLLSKIHLPFFFQHKFFLLDFKNKYLE